MRTNAAGSAEQYSRHKYATRAALAALLIACAMIANAMRDDANAAVVTFHCRNTTSDYKWDVKVDLDRNTADGFPANIAATSVLTLESVIRWRDRKEGADFELNPQSGRLTQFNASSMGGNLLFHQCSKG